MKTNHKLMTLIVLVLAITLTACGGNQPPEDIQAVPQAPEGVIAEGHIVPNDALHLAFSARGRVAEILVEPGDEVSKDDILIRLADSEQAQAALAATRLELLSAQQTYDDFVRNADFSRADAWQIYIQAQRVRITAARAWEQVDTDAIQDRIDDAETELADREEELKDAQETFDKYADLNEENATRKAAEDDLEEAQEAYDEASRRLDEIHNQRDTARAALDAALAAESESRRQFDLSVDGPNAEKLALLEARLTNAQAQVAAAENALANYELKAPFDGTVMDVNVSVNQMVGPEKWAVVVADLSAWYVETSDLTELEVVKIFEGQSVEITPDALDDVVLTGQVEEISRAFTVQGGDILYAVRIQLDDFDTRLRWGMTVEVAFLEE